MSTMNDSDIHLQKCPYHETENQTFYCVNHDVKICGRCLYSNHKLCIDSNVDLFTVSVDEARHSETFAMLRAFEEKIEGYKKTLSEDIALNDQYKLNSMAAIDSFCCKMINRLNNLKTHAEIECTKIHKHNSERLSQLVKKCNEEKCMITQRKHLVEVLVQKQHSRHLYIEIGRLDRNKKDILTRTNDLIQDKVKVKFSFRPNDKLENVIFHEINDISKIQETTNDIDEVPENQMQDSTWKEVHSYFGFRENTETLCDIDEISSKKDSKTKLYTMYGNVIAMLEEYEARTDMLKLPRSAIDIPDQSWKTDENIMDNVESQLVLFEANMEACPAHITSSVNEELRIKTIYWTAVREEKRLPRTGTDIFIARLYEILAERARVTPTFMNPISKRMWTSRKQAKEIDVSFEQNQKQNLAGPKTRTPTNSSDFRIGAKRIQNVNPSLGPCLQADVGTESLELTGRT